MTVSPRWPDCVVRDLALHEVAGQRTRRGLASVIETPVVDVPGTFQCDAVDIVQKIKNQTRMFIQTRLREAAPRHTHASRRSGQTNQVLRSS